MTTPRGSLEPYLKDDVEYYPHQVEGIRQMARMRSFLLADDMGLGKSLQALTVFCIDVKMDRAQTLLVVCPVSLRENWADEIEKFTRLPYTMLGQEADPNRRGRWRKVTTAVREQQLQEFLAGEGPRILISNYEQIGAEAHEATLAKAHFDMVVFDEAHYIKNHKSKRTKASLKLISSRSALLTGTPMLNNAEELWPLLHRIDPKRWASPWTFIARYCVMGGYNNKQIVGMKNGHELKGVLADVMIRRVKADVLKLPKPYIITVKVGLSEYQQKLYDEAVGDLKLGEEDIANAAVLFGRLKQICSTPYAINDSYPDESEKLDRLVEIAQEVLTNGEKLVVFTQFRGTLDAILKRLHKVRPDVPLFQLHGNVPPTERVGIVKEWASVSGPSVIVCMLQVAGVGLNMTAARTAIFADLLFVPGLNQQAIDRLHRIGASETQPVQIFELVARGTCEDRIQAILKAKKKLFGEIVEESVGLKRLLNELLEAEIEAKNV